MVWEFKMVAAGEWHWRHLSNEGAKDELRSKRVFSTLHEAIADAQRHGYFGGLAAPSSAGPVESAQQLPPLRPRD